MSEVRVFEVSSIEDVDGVMVHLFVSRALADAVSRKDLERIVQELQDDWGFSELGAKEFLFKKLEELK